MYKPLTYQDKNFKLKQIAGQWYNNLNGSSATWVDAGCSRRTGTFKLWTGFKRNVNSTSLVDLGSGITVQQKLLYNSINSIVKKYTGSYRSSVSQPNFYCIAFDKDAFGDFVNISDYPNQFLMSNSTTYIKKSLTRLNDNRIYNTNNYIPVVEEITETQVGVLFPTQGLYVHYNQTYALANSTYVTWQPINYKQNAFYFCRANSRGFNFSNNSSFTAGSSTRTYITTIGLYGQRTSDDLGASRSPLLAVAKVALPIAKNDETQFIFKISLEF